MIATIFALFFGDHHALHARLLNSLKQFGPEQNVRYRFWFNQVCDKTKKLVANLMIGRDMRIRESNENVRKYIVMREMFEADRQTESQPEWLIWFDDDSYVVRPDWWKTTLQYIEKKRAENICYLGQSWYVHHLQGQMDFIKEATWYRGVPWEMCPTKKPGVRKPGITFAQGSYWWLRRDVRDAINWPDPRILHNGGDTMLGEAIRQQGLPFHKYHYGVKLNSAPRRGLSEIPAGSTEDVRR